MTIHDKLCQALTNLGCKPVLNARTGKYTVFTGEPAIPRKLGGKPKFIYVGIAGACRYGLTATNSISLSDDTKRALIERGQAAVLAVL